MKGLIVDLEQIRVVISRDEEVEAKVEYDAQVEAEDSRS